MKENIKNEIKEWIYSLVIAAVLAFAIKAFIFDIIQVSGRSMVPTLHNNDRVIVEKISMYRKKIYRGEIVILDPGSKGRGIYIKRIIGLPNETVEIKDGNVYINGDKLQEDYLEPGTYTDVDLKITVPEDCVFVLGDNREVSEDSRYIGPIPIKNLKGHAVLRVYPFNDIKKLR